MTLVNLKGLTTGAKPATQKVIYCIILFAEQSPSDNILQTKTKGGATVMKKGSAGENFVVTEQFCILTGVVATFIYSEKITQNYIHTLHSFQIPGFHFIL